MPSKTGMDRIQVYEQPERLATVVLTHYNAQTGLGFKIDTIHSPWAPLLIYLFKTSSRDYRTRRLTKPFRLSRFHNLSSTGSSKEIRCNGATVLKRNVPGHPTWSD